MILSLALFAVASPTTWDPSYNLIPPHRLTELGEIGFWTLRGSATNLKKLIRLTSNAAAQSGGVCLRLPVRTRHWMLHIEVQIHPGLNAGSGFFLSFTSDVCSDTWAKPNGFGIWIDTGSPQPDASVPVFFIEGEKGASKRQIGSVRIRTNPTSPAVLYIARNDHQLVFDILQNFQYERIGILDVDDLLKFGYFTLTANTTSDGDIHDLISFRLFILDDLTPDKQALQDNVDYDVVNRKIIRQAKQARHESKDRRRQQMPTVFSLVNEAKDGQLTGEAVELKKALRVLVEAQMRVGQEVTLKKLAQLINGPLSKTIEVADRKLRHASERFSETQDEITELWSTLKTSLIDLGIEATTEMAKIEADFLAAIEWLNLTGIDVSGAKKPLKEQAGPIADSSLSMLLLAIAFIEVFCYVAFFCIRRKTTHGFKKAD
jgi:hypothetical protein